MGSPDILGQAVSPKPKTLGQTRGPGFGFRVLGFRVSGFRV